MVDPAEIIDDLVMYLTQRLGRTVFNGALGPALVKPGAAELAITAMDASGSPDGTPRLTWQLEGYVALHHNPNATSAAEAVREGLRLTNALHRWAATDYAQGLEPLGNFSYGEVDIRLNSFTLGAERPVVLSVVSALNLQLTLEVGDL